MSSPDPPGGGDESTGTVLLAGGANLGIAIAKTVGGLLSGSTAMLAEAAHSFADTMNQVFLLTALKRSKKPADAQHPFGYGMERYFWSLLAAVGIFVLGAGFSIYEGIAAILVPEEVSHLVIAYTVLGISFVLEGISWLKALRQVRGEAAERGLGVAEHVRASTDPTAKTVAFEDTAALIGIVLAAVGLTLHELTGQGFWDGAASVAIGLLLIVIAYVLGNENKAMLIGQSVSEQVRDGIREEIADSPGIDGVVELLTMRLGPDEVLVAVRVDMDDTASGDALERFAEDVDQRVRDRYPEVRHVFLDPTDATRHDEELTEVSDLA
ncbi:MAG: cation transporter [Propionibacteriales bacterium]|nr:cation transporter [Propionibacteriales bacterium]